MPAEVSERAQVGSVSRSADRPRSSALIRPFLGTRFCTCHPRVLQNMRNQVEFRWAAEFLSAALILREAPVRRGRRAAIRRPATDRLFEGAQLFARRRSRTCVLASRHYACAKWQQSQGAGAMTSKPMGGAPRPDGEVTTRMWSSTTVPALQLVI